MKTLIPITFTFLFIMACTSSAPLFLGMGNWQLIGSAAWEFDTNSIIGEAEGEAGYLVSNDVFDDFILELEFHPTEKVNSGIFIRCADEEMSPMNCYEINISDNHPKPAYRTGAIVMKSEPLERVNTIGKWNTYKIKAKGTKIQAWINSTKVAEIIDADRAKGYIGLQAHENGKVMFRNIEIKEL